jgi:DegV family protein with EDD domain
MPEVAIVVDTTHYMPRELVEANGLHEVSLYVNQGDRHERESDMPDFDAFYEGLRTSAQLPTTSQPSIGDFLAVYEPLVEEGRDIVSVHISGGISGTVESARQAASDLRARKPQRRIEVIDTQSACGIIALTAMAGAAAARAGGDIDAVTARVRSAVDIAKIWFAVDTLEFLRRGGRIGTAQAWLGGALKIKPILTVDGEITPIERVRTSGGRVRRLGRAAHPGTRSGGRPRRPRPRDLRQGPGLRRRDRPRHRDARRPGPARRRRDPEQPDGLGAPSCSAGGA